MDGKHDRSERRRGIAVVTRKDQVDFCNAWSDRGPPVSKAKREDQEKTASSTQVHLRRRALCTRSKLTEEGEIREQQWFLDRCVVSWLVGAFKETVIIVTPYSIHKLSAFVSYGVTVTSRMQPSLAPD